MAGHRSDIRLVTYVQAVTVANKLGKCKELITHREYYLNEACFRCTLRLLGVNPSRYRTAYRVSYANSTRITLA